MYIKNIIYIFATIFINTTSYAQELFVFTEPASNMAKHSLGLRLNNYAMKENGTKRYDYRLMPEVMFGISKKLMVHVDFFLNNSNTKNLSGEGGSVYVKYRFYSKDDIQSHFRMSTYARYSFNNTNVLQDEIETYGNNTGYELGLVATQLLHKVALSGSVSYEKALKDQTFLSPSNAPAINYTFSIGKLVLPKEYINYKQTNLNLMVELLGQTKTDNGLSYLDIAPAIQLIINSQSRIDFGYRRQLYNSMKRINGNSYIIRFEYNFFNIL